MTFILSILFFSLAVMGITFVFRHGKEKKNNEQDPQKNSSGESSSFVSSISGVFSKKKDDFSKARKAVSKSHFQMVPLLKVFPVSKTFLGRKNILTDVFSHLGKEPVLIGLYGSSGVGKTTLGGVVVKNLLTRYSAEPIYIDMRGSSVNPLSQEEVMIRVINLLRSSEIFPETEAQRVHLYTTLLQRRNVILFLDNVPNSQTVKSLLPPKNCALIVTSLKPLTVPGLISNKVNPMDIADAQNLLSKTSPRTSFWCNEIAAMCSNFPQALVLAGQYVSTYQNQDCGKFVESLRQGLKSLQSKPGSEDKKSMNVVLNISYRSLSEKATAVLRKLILFPETFDRKAATFLCEDLDNEHLISLLTLGLVNHNNETNRFSLHHLVRQFLTLRLKESEQALAEKRFATYFLTVMIAAGELYELGGKERVKGLNLFDLEWDNIKKGRDWSETNSEKDQEAGNLCLSYTDAAVTLLGHRKSSRERLQWFEAALGSARRLNDKIAESKYLLLLGIEYNQLNRGEEALDHLEEALELSKQSEDETMERKALGQLGLAHLVLGKPRRAIEFLEKELELHKKSDESEDQESMLENLGRIYFEVGDINRAIEYYKKELFQVEKGNDRKRQGRIFGDLGKIYLSKKDHTSAIENFDRGLNLVRKNEDKKGEINLLGKLGTAYLDVEKFQKALTYFQQGLALSQVLKDRTNMALMMDLIGHCHLKSGIHREAIANFEKALAIYKKSGDKAKEGETLWNLAQATMQSKKIPEAIKLAEEALIFYRKIKRLSGDTKAIIEKQLKEWEGLNGKEAPVDATEKPAP